MISKIIQADYGESHNMMQYRYEDFAQRYDLFFGKFGEHNPLVIEFFRQVVERKVEVYPCGQNERLF